MSDIQPLSKLSILGKIQSIEDGLLTLPQINIPLFHHHGKDSYAREAHIPKGSLVTGRVHLHDNMNFLMKGDISVMTEEGMKRFIAPSIICSKSGIKRIAYAHEDCIWVTVIGTEITNPDEIEAKFTASSERDYLEHCKPFELKGI